MDENMFMPDAPAEQPVELATVTETLERKSRIRLDDEAAAGQKQYACAAHYTPCIGDRVLIKRIGKEFFIMGKVG